MRRSRHKKRRPVPVPIASMGDIAFLLIIFFMVLSEFAKDPDLQLTPPVYANVEKSQATLAARVAIDKNGVIYFQGNRVESAKDIEWGVRALLDGTQADDQRHVQFKCDREIERAKFEPVLKAIAEAGGIVEAVADKPSP